MNRGGVDVCVFCGWMVVDERVLCEVLRCLDREKVLFASRPHFQYLCGSWVLRRLDELLGTASRHLSHLHGDAGPAVVWLSPW